VVRYVGASEHMVQVRKSLEVPVVRPHSVYVYCSVLLANT
jgi:hypothetical protein